MRSMETDVHRSWRSNAAKWVTLFVVASLLPSRAVSQVCGECDDATRPCLSCAVDVSYVTEPLSQLTNVTVEGNLFLGSFMLRSVRPETLRSWQVTWIFQGEGVYEGLVNDAILINPGGPGGQPARVVNQLDAEASETQGFSFIGYTADGQTPLSVNNVGVNGVTCKSARPLDGSSIDARCSRREYRFCCGSEILPPPPSIPSTPPSPPSPENQPSVVVQRGALSAVTQRGTAWLRNGSTMSALVVSGLICLVLTIEVYRRIRHWYTGEESILVTANLEGVVSPMKRKNTMMLPGQCFKLRSDDLEGVVVHDDDTARMRAGLNPACPTSLFEGSLESYVTQELEMGDDDDQQVVEINLKNIVLGKLIGRGAHGVVYAAKWNKRAVAVKKLHAMSSVHQSDLKTFVREVSVLSAIKHPKIVQLFGACLKQPHLCIVEEIMDGGSLHAILHDMKRNLDLDDIIRIANDVATAMEYLHAKNIVHRDLKSHNVLLNSHGAKVADFGIARALQQTLLSGMATQTSQSGSIGGTPAYMAPELFHGDVYAVTTKCDVYSFSVLVWEMISGQIPWDGCANHMQIIFAVAIQSQRLPLESPEFKRNDATRALVDDIIVPSWQNEPESRPDFADLVKILNKLLNSRVDARVERVCKE